MATHVPIISQLFGTKKSDIEKQIETHDGRRHKRVHFIIRWSSPPLTTSQVPPRITRNLFFECEHNWPEPGPPALLEMFIWAQGEASILFIIIIL